MDRTCYQKTIRSPIEAWNDWEDKRALKMAGLRQCLAFCSPSVFFDILSHDGQGDIKAAVPVVFFLSRFQPFQNGTIVILSLLLSPQLLGKLSASTLGWGLWAFTACDPGIEASCCVMMPSCIDESPSLSATRCTEARTKSWRN